MTAPLKAPALRRGRAISLLAAANLIGLALIAALSLVHQVAIDARAEQARAQMAELSKEVGQLNAAVVSLDQAVDQARATLAHVHAHLAYHRRRTRLFPPPAFSRRPTARRHIWRTCGCDSGG